jgi:hypothetical protein
VYVNDIVMITRTKEEMAVLKRLILGKYKSRDRAQRVIELSMESHTDKLASDFKRIGAPARQHPMDLKALKLKLKLKLKL